MIVIKFSLKIESHACYPIKSTFFSFSDVHFRMTCSFLIDRTNSSRKKHVCWQHKSDETISIVKLFTLLVLLLLQFPWNFFLLFDRSDSILMLLRQMGCGGSRPSATITSVVDIFWILHDTSHSHSLVAAKLVLWNTNNHALFSSTHSQLSLFKQCWNRRCTF